MTHLDKEAVTAAAKALGSDGCSGVPDIHVECCYEHDIHYRTGRRTDGRPISRAEADAEFRRCLQMHSYLEVLPLGFKIGKLTIGWPGVSIHLGLGFLSPMSWWRWAAVRLLGGPHFHPATGRDPGDENDRDLAA